jgi:hypothetical protein
MAQQRKTGNIGAGVDTDLLDKPRSLLVKPIHSRHRCCHTIRIGYPRFENRGDDTDARGFREHQRAAGLRTTLGQHMVRVYQSHHR